MYRKYVFETPPFFRAYFAQGGDSDPSHTATFFLL